MFTDPLTPSSYLVEDRQARYRQEAKQHRLARLARAARRARGRAHQRPTAA